jgi:hypothetical protein
MNNQLIFVLIIGAAVVVAVALWFAVRIRRTEQLRSRFGPEYDRTVGEARSVAEGEAMLLERQTRVARLHVRPLLPADVRRFAQAWRDVQAWFVDDPKGAIVDADRLVGEVMHARGYPVGDFEQRVADISVDHPNVVMNYRAARDIVEDHGRGSASTEDLRHAMVHFRALFAELLGTPTAAADNQHQEDESILARRFAM